MKTKVLVIEGNRAGSPHFTPALRKKGYSVQVVQSGKEALQSAETLKPDIAVVNLASLRTSGKRICSLLRKVLNGKPIVAIHGQDFELNGEVEADAVLVLPFTPRKLLNRMNSLLPSQSEKLMEVGPISLDRELHLVQCEGKQTRLTPKLSQLLQKLMRKPGEVLERKDLFASVWQTEYTGDTRTLDVHISWLRQAIEADPRKPKYIITIRGVGYRLDA